MSMRVPCLYLEDPKNRSPHHDITGATLEREIRLLSGLARLMMSKGERAKE